jgi:hypothetical protein
MERLVTATATRTSRRREVLNHSWKRISRRGHSGAARLRSRARRESGTAASAASAAASSNAAATAPTAPRRRSRANPSERVLAPTPASQTPSEWTTPPTSRPG